MRNLAAGGAAFCAAALVALTQVGTSAIALKVAVIGASVALPLYIAYLWICEMHLILEEPPFKHMDSPTTRRWVNVTAMPAGVGLIASIGGITWYLYPPAVYLGALAICVALVASIRVVLSLARFSLRHHNRGTDQGDA